jgi:hypothetical protein
VGLERSAYGRNLLGQAGVKGSGADMLQQSKIGRGLFFIGVIALVVWPQDIVKLKRGEWQDHRITPYPLLHAADAAEKRVEVEIVVGADGSVESAHGVSGPAEFFAGAEALEKKQKFKPFTRNGAAITAAFADSVLIVAPEQWADRSRRFPAIQDWKSLRVNCGGRAVMDLVRIIRWKCGATARWSSKALATSW